MHRHCSCAPRHQTWCTCRHTFSPWQPHQRCTPCIFRGSSVMRHPSSSDTCVWCMPCHATHTCCWCAARLNQCPGGQLSSVAAGFHRACSPGRRRQHRVERASESQNSHIIVKSGASESQNIRHSAQPFTIIWLFCKGNGVIYQMWCTVPFISCGARQ